MKTLNFGRIALAIGLLLVPGGCVLEPAAVSPADLQKREQALAASDHLIVPGQRIGPIRLDMSMDAVTALLGQPDYTFKDSASGRITWTYQSLNLKIIFASETIRYVICVITLASDRPGDDRQTVWEDFEPVKAVFKTAGGIGLGESSDEVKQVYGSYNTAEYDPSGMFYVKLGIDFDVLSDQRVWCIEVNRFRF